MTCAFLNVLYKAYFNTAYNSNETAPPFIFNLHEGNSSIVVCVDLIQLLHYTLKRCRQKYYCRPSWQVRFPLQTRRNKNTTGCIKTRYTKTLHRHNRNEHVLFAKFLNLSIKVLYILLCYRLGTFNGDLLGFIQIRRCNRSGFIQIRRCNRSGFIQMRRCNKSRSFWRE